MLVTLSGIVTLDRRKEAANALFPMLVTGRPLVVLGMSTAPPEPVYPLMVIVPLLVVRMNWPSTTTGSVNSNKSGSSTLTRVFIRHSDSRKKGSLALSYVPFYSFCGTWQERSSSRTKFKQIAEGAELGTASARG